MNQTVPNSNWEYLRSSVQRFALLMEEQLRANDHKSGWDRDSLSALMHRLREETEELSNAINSTDGATIPEEAADVANFAMMIADNWTVSCSARPTMTRMHEAVEITFDRVPVQGTAWTKKKHDQPGTIEWEEHVEAWRSTTDSTGAGSRRRASPSGAGLDARS